MAKSPKFRKWIPRKWKPIYERIVIMSASGMGNVKIGELVGFTKEHVSNILNLPQAEEFREKVLVAMREKALSDVPAMLDKIAVLTTRRTMELLEDNGKFENAPFAILDRGYRIMEGTGALRKSPGVVVNNQVSNDNRTLNLSSDQVDRISEALESANRVRELHEGEGNTKSLPAGRALN